VAVSLSPGSHPFPVGSTDGSVWNVMFVFNGFGRVSGPPAHGPGGPGPLRLVQASPWHFDKLAGSVLIAALAIGAAGLIAMAIRRRAEDRVQPRPLARAFAVALAVWIAVAVWVLSSVGTMHTRYMEALAPALAAAVGFGAAALAGLSRKQGTSGAPPSIPLITLALAGVCAYDFGLGSLSIAWGAVAISVSTIGAALLARDAGRLAFGARWLTAALIVATAVLFPVHESLSVVRAKTNDSAGLATASRESSQALEAYVGPRTIGLRYELAVDEPLALAPLIIHDQRPILPLTSFHGLPAVGLPELRAAVRAGAVRYGLVGKYYCGPHQRTWASCGAAALWIRRNGIDISSAAGLEHANSRLYLLLPPS
jgi:hypothetical protein